MRSARPSRHLAFHDLVEALGQPGCPVCRLAARSTERWLRALFHEQVNDGELRARLRRARGFCARHAARAVELGDSLGSSIIYADVLEHVATSLQEPPSEPCPACAHGHATTDNALSTLLAHLAEPDVEAAYRAAEGLCLPHLRQALSRRVTPASSSLEAIERGKLVELAAQCAEFTAKCDYRRSGEAMGPERDAWLRAARKLGGEIPG